MTIDPLDPMWRASRQVVGDDPDGRIIWLRDAVLIRDEAVEKAEHRGDDYTVGFRHGRRVGRCEPLSERDSAVRWLVTTIIERHDMLASPLTPLIQYEVEKNGNEALLEALAIGGRFERARVDYSYTAPMCAEAEHPIVRWWESQGLATCWCEAGATSARRPLPREVAEALDKLDEAKARRGR
jgi:hypothetical protein